MLGASGTTRGKTVHGTPNIFPSKNTMASFLHLSTGMMSKLIGILPAIELVDKYKPGQAYLQVFYISLFCLDG